jgi:putative membrane protein
VKTHLLTFLQGLAIGAANAIPGVSGGTLALVFGIYERLIESLKALAQRPFWSDLLKLNLAGAFKTINGTFLVVLVAGAMLSLLTLAQGLEWLFSHYPTLILSFFFGLILASILPVSRHIDRWQAHTITAFVLGILFGFVLVGLTPSQLPTTRPFLFLSGALAASAMIVPGISGAFVLVLLGNYDAILSILNDRNFSLILVIGLAYSA